MNKKKLKEIADEQIISESAIKREMLEIYRVFKVEDRHELYRRLSEYTVI
jgi:DNA-binding NarL/FixJ family response regulator